MASQEKTRKKKTGRKLLKIDSEQVLKLARLGALNTEIADFFCCDEGTIRKRFSEILKKGRAERKVKLRELQWRSAESGNVTMLIWLGKQDLEQRDRIIDKGNGGARTAVQALIDEMRNEGCEI